MASSRGCLSSRLRESLLAKRLSEQPPGKALTSGGGSFRYPGAVVPSNGKEVLTYPANP
jgi:hypothetical protein